MLYILIAILCFPVALFLIVREPVIQNYLAASASEYLSDRLQTEIRVGGLRVNVFLDVLVDDVLIKDRQGNLLLSADKLQLDVDEIDLQKRQVDFDKLFVDKADLNLITYEGDSSMNLQFLIDYFKTKTPTNDSIPSWNVNLDKVKVYDSRFHLLNQNKAGRFGAMDYSDLEVDGIHLIIDDVQLRSDSITFKVNNLEAYEKSGLYVEKLKGNFVVNPRKVVADHLKIITENSELSMNLKFAYDDFGAFKEFVDEVYIEAVVGNSILNLYDIGYFAPVMFEINNELEISGTFAGTVSSLRARNFKFNYGEKTRLEGDITVNGLPDIEETFSNLDIKLLTTSVKDIESMQLPVKDGSLDVPEQLEMFGDIWVKGYFTGFYNDFVSNASFKTDLGRIVTDVSLQQVNKDSVTYKGHLRATDFKIGEFLSVEEYLGEFDVNAQIEGSGLTAENVVVNLDGQIDSMNFLRDRFDNIRIHGDLANKKFVGSLKIDDKKLGLDFNGKIDFHSKVPAFDFYADIDSARMAALNIFDADTSMILSTTINVRFLGTDIDKMEGTIRLDSTVYHQGAEDYYMKNFDLIVSRDTSQSKSIKLNSDFVDAEIYGNFLFKEFYPVAVNFLDNYLSSLEFPGKDLSGSLSPQDVNFTFFFKEPRPITKLFVPGLYVADSAVLGGSFNSAQKHLVLTAYADTARFGGVRYDNWFLESWSDSVSLTLRTGVAEMLFREVEDNDSLTLGIDSTVFVANIQKDSIKYEISWDDSEDVDWNAGSIAGFVDFIEYPRIEARISKANIRVNDSTWRIGNDNFFVIDSSAISIRNFSVTSKDQQFLASGSISESNSDTLNLSFNKWRFSNFDMFFISPDIDFDGEINGSVQLYDLYRQPGFEADLNIMDLYFNKEKIGDLYAFARYDRKRKVINSEIEIVNRGGKQDFRTLFLAGDYYPERRKDNLDMKLKLTNFSLKPFNPFVSMIFNNLQGFASGEVAVSGSIDSPDLKGDINLMRAGLKVNYLNVSYDFAHQINIEDGRFSTEGMILYDSLGNTAALNGTVTHDNFNNFRLDLNIEPRALAVMNTGSEDNDLLYGSAFGSGVARIHGPFNNIRMDINAITEKGTSITIPITYNTELYERDYIVFVNTADTTEIEESYSVNLTGLDMNFELTATPDAHVQLFLPEDLGNIRATGNGNVNIEIDPRGGFTINGDYEISEGTFLFKLRNLVKRRFDLLQGGTITWTGSPYDAEINVRGLYRVKTTLDGLGLQADTSSAGYGQRVTVNCIIELRNQLFDPDIHFRIELPYVEDQTRQMVYSVLDTTNEALMNQQMISLLVLGNFSYQQGSFEQSSYKLLSNQLSNWLSQISQDVDIGVNYRPGDQISQEELEVALSTQLFNERVIIDGNFGVIGSQQSNNASNIVGDVNVEVKLTEDGRFRVKAFNRSNYNSIYDVTTFDNIAPYTQGIGVFYRKEFDTFGELFQQKKKDNIAVEFDDLQ